MTTKQQPRTWALWFTLTLLGSGTTIWITTKTTPIQHIGNPNFWTAAAAIITTLTVTIPAYTLYHHTRNKTHPNWHEKIWKPTPLTHLTTLTSILAATTAGHQIIIRLTREWPT